MSMKKVYSRQVIKFTTHAAVAIEMPSGNCVRKGATKPSFTKDYSNSSQIVTDHTVHEVGRRKALYSPQKKAALIRKENAIREINGMRSEFLEARSTIKFSLLIAV